ncbi:MAG: YtxH domain-containing protein [Acidobacteriota bacterium]
MRGAGHWQKTYSGGFMANAQGRVDRRGSGGGSFVMGLLAGTVIGAGIAMLFAPKPGSEFRRDLGEHVDRFATDASKTYRKATVEATEWARKASDAAEEVTERGKELYNDVRDAVAKGADEAQRFRQEANGGDPVRPGGSTGSQAG